MALETLLAGQCAPTNSNIIGNDIFGVSTTSVVGMGFVFTAKFRMGKYQFRQNMDDRNLC